MKKIISIVFTLVLFYNSYSQNHKYIDLIKPLESQKEVLRSQKLHPLISIGFNKFSKTDSNFDSILKNRNKKDIIEENEHRIHKLINIDSILEFRVKYIFLDGNKIGQKKAKKIQQSIITKFKNGLDFSDLANKYTMDPRKNGGDLDWFPEGRMVKPFEKAIKEHKKDDVFEAYYKERNWFFVILKTHIERVTYEYEYITIDDLKTEYLKSDKTKEKHIKTTIAFSVDEFNDVSKLDIKKIEFANCNKDEINDKIIRKVIINCFNKVDQKVKEESYRAGNLFIIPFLHKL